MAKRKNAPQQERAAEATARAARGVRQGVRHPAAPEMSLRLAPTDGPRQSARQPARVPTPPADAQPTPAAPKRPRKSSSRRIGDLRNALAEGWEIVQPIFARPLWSAADDSQTAYNFVLRRDQATRLLTIPDSRTVARFIAAHSLTVDYPR